MKIGIIRCMQTEDMCAGATDFKVVANRLKAFEGISDGEIIGFVSCGGCPGKKAVSRAQMLADKGADIIAFASCMRLGNPIGFPCPHFTQIYECVDKKLGYKVKLLDWTH
jgi:predicted metal-binding protein